MSGVVIAVYTVLMAITYAMDVGLLYLCLDFALYTASSVVFIQAVVRIRRAMQSFEIAFSNEKFMRIHAVNFMVYLTVSLVTFGLSLAYSKMADDKSQIPSVELLRT